jgi:hypothetical protein
MMHAARQLPSWLIFDVGHRNRGTKSLFRMSPTYRPKKMKASHTGSLVVAALVAAFSLNVAGQAPNSVPIDSVDRAIADEIADRFGGDRTKFLKHLRDRNMTVREYRGEVEARIANAIRLPVRVGQVEFVGFADSAEGMRFVLKDSQENKASDWLHLEQSFRGIRLVAYDAQREILTVEKEGSRLELPLRTPQVQSGSPSAQASDTPRKYRVGSIVIKAPGDTSPPEAVVKGAMQIRPGGTFDEKTLDQDIRSIYRTGQFKFVEVKHEQRKDGTLDLVVIVTPKSP